MCIMMLFNQAEQFTYADILRLTNIPEEVFFFGLSLLFFIVVVSFLRPDMYYYDVVQSSRAVVHLCAYFLTNIPEEV